MLINLRAFVFAIILFLATLPVWGQVCAPAEVSTDLLLWYRAENIQAKSGQVSRWVNQVSKAQELTPTLPIVQFALDESFTLGQSIEEPTPTLLPAILNGHDAVRFENGSFLSTDNVAFQDKSNFTAFLVLRSSDNTLNDGADIFTYGDGITEFVRLESQDSSYQLVFGNSYTSPQMKVDQFNWSILTINAGQEANRIKIFGNGNLEWNQYVAPVPFMAANLAGRLTVGRRLPDTLNNWYGDMGEIIVYDRGLSISEQQAIESQLAIKFGISIADSAHEYYDAGADNCNKGIAGIGLDREACLQQLSSSSFSLLSTPRVRFANPSDMDEEEYFVWGTDTDTQSETWLTFNNNWGTVRRLARNWHVTETGEVGTLDLAFQVAGLGLENVGADGLALLVGNRYNNYRDTRVVKADAKVGNTLYFYGLDISDQAYFTLAEMQFEDQDRDGIKDKEDLDADNDGILNIVESGPELNADQDQDGVPNYLDLDSDNDGISDLEESGWNAAEWDRDGDGRVDSNFPVGANGAVDQMETGPEAGGFLISARDADLDGIIDAQDLDSDNDGMSDLQEAGRLFQTLDLDADGVVDGSDTDTDGIKDKVDARAGAGGIYFQPLNTDKDALANYIDLDSDNDGVGDLHESGRIFMTIDLDLDGVVDGSDNDTDGIKDAIDTGPGFGGTDVPIINRDGDARADYLDLDSDNDGISDLIESGLNFRTIDLNLDGVVDGSDTDTDGIQDAVDLRVGAGGSGQVPADQDGDGLINARDADSDQDGIYDLIEIGLSMTLYDVDRDGVVDGDDTDADGIKDLINAEGGGLNVLPVDTDGDGVLDFLDADSDNDGILDLYEALDPTDSLELKGIDTDMDGIDDRVDIHAPDGDPFPLNDSDGDGKANYIDTDSDGDGLSDFDEAWDELMDGDRRGDIDCLSATDADGDGLLSCFDADDNDPRETHLLLLPPDDNGYDGLGNYTGDSVATWTRLADLFPDNGDRTDLPDFLDNSYTYTGGHEGALVLAMNQPTKGYREQRSEVEIVRATKFWVDSTGWANYYHPAQPDQFLFSIRHRDNVTPIDYVELRIDQGSRSVTDTFNNAGYFAMRRDWNVKTFDDAPLLDSLGNPTSVDVRFYFDLFELDYLMEQSLAFASSTAEGEVGVPVWFKTPNGTDGFDLSYLSGSGLINVVDLGLENNFASSGAQMAKGYGKVGSATVAPGSLPAFATSLALGEGPPDGRGVLFYSSDEVWTVAVDSMVPQGGEYRLRVRNLSPLYESKGVVKLEESSDGVNFFPTKKLETTNGNKWKDLNLKAEREVRFLRVSKGSSALDEGFELDAILIGSGISYPNSAEQLPLPSLADELCFKQFEGITGFSGGTMAVPVQGSASPFPVEWLSVSTQKSDSNIIVHWSTAVETNNHRFEIERAINNGKFHTVGEVQAAGQGATYQFGDQGAALLQVNQLYYRVKQIDVSGLSSYSESVAVTLNQRFDPALAIYPNPVREKLIIRYIAAANGQALELEVLNLLGRRMHHQPLTPTGLLDEISVPIQTWLPGIYLVRISSETGSQMVKVKITDDQ